jgi:hypothetical protein
LSCDDVNHMREKQSCWSPLQCSEQSRSDWRSWWVINWK